MPETPGNARGLGSFAFGFVVPTTTLIKVMGLRLNSGDQDRLDVRSLDGNGVVLILQDTVHAEKLFPVDNDTVFLIKVGIHNHIGNSRFIFKTQKDETFGGPRTLPRNHASRHARVLTIRQSRQIARTFHLLFGQSRTAIGHRMRPSAHTGAMKIRDKTLFVRHLFEWGQFHLLRDRIQKWAGRSGGTFDLPQRSPSVQSFSERVEGSDFAEGHQLRFLQLRDAADEIVDSLERTILPLTDNSLYSRLPQTANVAQPDAQARNFLTFLVSGAFNRTVPFRLKRIDGLHSQAV